MKTALFIGVLLASLLTAIWSAVEGRRELASAQTRAVMCEQTGELADRVILTCLSQQTIVKMELQALGSLVRQQKDCK